MTMEVNDDNEICQVYGRFNALPEVEVYRFLEKYASKKKLQYDPYDLILLNDDDIIENPEDYEELWEYAYDYWKRKSLQSILYEQDETQYVQLTLEDVFPEEKDNLSGCRSDA